MTKPQWMTALRLILVVGSVGLVCWMLTWAVPLFLPFILAWIIAFIINPVVNFLEIRLRLPRILAVMLTLSVFVLALISVTILLVTQMIIEITQLLNILPATLQSVQDYVSTFLTQEIVLNFIEQLNQVFSHLDPEFQVRINNTINQSLDQITDSVTQLFMQILSSFLGFLTSLPNTGILLLVSLAAALFVSKDWYTLQRWLFGFLPQKIKRSGLDVWGNLREATLGFIRAQLLLISITGVAITTYLLILGVDYAITLGIIMAIFDLLPYLGVGTILVPWSVYCFFTGNVPLGLALGVLYLVVAVTRQILEPKVVGDRVGLNPLLTLIGLYVGLQVYGISGALIGPLAMLIGVSIYRARIFHQLWEYITEPLRQG